MIVFFCVVDCAPQVRECRGLSPGLTRVRNTDSFRDACRVMRQRVEICSHHRYVDDEDEEEHNVDIGGLSVRDYVIYLLTSLRTV